MKRDPYVVIEWNDRATGAKGWLAVDSMVDGYAAGGIRMNTTVTKEEVIRLAQVMSYKYVAAQSETGGAKGGIRYDYHQKDALDVLKRYLQAMKPYIEAGVAVGEDLGTRNEDIRRLSQELGIGPSIPQHIRENPKVQEGSDNIVKLLGENVDGLDMNRVVTGYGVAMAADEAWKLLNGKASARVAIQGFGSVGGSAALWLQKQGYKVVAIADVNATYYNNDGLNIKDLIDSRNEFGEIVKENMKSECEVKPREAWLEMDVDILIPAAVEDVINEDTATKIKASLLVEAANIPTNDAGDKILKERGIRLVPDFIANLGAVCFFNSVNFGKCPATPEGVLKRINDVIREDVRKTFEKAKAEGIYEREAAIKLFTPA